MKIDEAQKLAKNALTPMTENPFVEAQVLLAFVLKKQHSYLLAWPKKELSAGEVKIFTEMLKRRCNHEPLAYITGFREFWSLDLIVSPDALIPRPETECLVDSVLNLVEFKDAAIKVADLGTGSGAIALALAKERPQWQLYATDISEAALQLARHNAKRIALNNIAFYNGSWCAALPCVDFDIIVSNPPYIAESEWETYALQLAYEPKCALVSGCDGLDAIREISRSAKRYLKPSGYLLVEHGYSQGVAVRNLFAAFGYQSIHTVCDLSRHERITIGRAAQKGNAPGCC